MARGRWRELRHAREAGSCGGRRGSCQAQSYSTSSWCPGQLVHRNWRWQSAFVKLALMFIMRFAGLGVMHGVTQQCDWCASSCTAGVTNSTGLDSTGWRDPAFANRKANKKNRSNKKARSSLAPVRSSAEHPHAPAGTATCSGAGLFIRCRHMGRTLWYVCACGVPQRG